MKNIKLAKKSINLMLASAVFTASLTLFVACKDENANFLQDQNFSIEKIIFKDKELSAVAESFLGFKKEDDKDIYAGFVGCNRFFGSFKFQNNLLKFSDDATSTKMLCEPEIMQFEDILLTNLKEGFKIKPTKQGFELASKDLSIFLLKR